MNTNLRRKKNDSDSNFYNFSLLVPYPNNFLLVCICILIFHGIYPLPPPTNIYIFCGVYNFFSCLVARGWENFKFLGDLLRRGDLIPFLGERSTPFSSIKPSMTNHANSRIVDGKIIGFMCVC